MSLQLLIKASFAGYSWSFLQAVSADVPEEDRSAVAKKQFQAFVAAFAAEVQEW